MESGKEVQAELRTRLAETALKCSERGLYQSAKWASELLNSIPEGDEALDASMTDNDDEQNDLERREAHRYLLAKSLFDTREYDRCAAVFLGVKRKDVDLGRLSQKSLFLALYARFIAGEKRKDEESEMVLGPNDGGKTINRELSGVAQMLEAYFSVSGDRSQGWLEYLYGVVLAKSKNDDAAREWLVRAINRNPFHWGAWEELATLLPAANESLNEAVRQALPRHIMNVLFEVQLSIDLSNSSNSVATQESIDGLLRIFPGSTFLLTSLALLHYHSSDFEAAALVFQQILTAHPQRLDALDHYSNILYVMQDRPRLSFLAHLATSVDKFRPETCCVVGNYYSLCSQHEKAVIYFRRALTLDKNFLSAWTLMGHEYVEMKNTHAAIESYRRAVDLNRKDYRAWYGLGQAYEVLDMAFYALFYYQRAAALRPYDPKMWQAVGSCYAKMGRVEQSIKALKRALVAGTYYEPVPTPQQSFSASMSSQVSQKTGRKLLDPDTLFQIATLYEKLDDLEEAAKYMQLALAQETGSMAKKISKASEAVRREDDATEIISDEDSDEEFEQGDGFGTGTTATTSKARLWLARWAVRTEALDLAERLAEELCVDGYEVEEAKSLIREVRGRREAREGESQ